MSHSSFSRFLFVDVVPLPHALLPLLSVYRYYAVPHWITQQWFLRASHKRFGQETGNEQRWRCKLLLAQTRCSSTTH